MECNEHRLEVQEHYKLWQMPLGELVVDVRARQFKIVSELNALITLFSILLGLCVGIWYVALSDRNWLMFTVMSVNSVFLLWTRKKVRIEAEWDVCELSQASFILGERANEGRPQGFR